MEADSFEGGRSGSVCRRQSTQEAADIFADLSLLKLRLHGFGLKGGFLKLAIGHGLESFDSMAWSFRARRAALLDGCPHKSCANCYRYAMGWRESILAKASRPAQAILF